MSAERPAGRVFVWHRADGRIVGVGALSPDAPPGLQISEPPGEPGELRILEIDPAHHHDPPALLERFRVVDGELTERSADEY